MKRTMIAEARKNRSSRGQVAFGHGRPLPSDLCRNHTGDERGKNHTPQEKKRAGAFAWLTAFRTLVEGRGWDRLYNQLQIAPDGTDVRRASHRFWRDPLEGLPAAPGERTIARTSSHLSPILQT
jgi:hypothetical protein